MNRSDFDELAAMYKAVQSGDMSENDAKYLKMVVRVETVLSALPIDLQVVMRPRLREGLMWKEVAERTGLTIDQCKRRGAEAYKLLNSQSTFGEIMALHRKMMEEGVAHTFVFSPKECVLECGDMFATQGSDSGGIDVSGVLTAQELKKDSVIYDLKATEVFRRIK